jgi:hypothetical protein
MHERPMRNETKEGKGKNSKPASMISRRKCPPHPKDSQVIYTDADLS